MEATKLTQVHSQQAYTIALLPAPCCTDLQNSQIYKFLLQNLHLFRHKDVLNVSVVTVPDLN